MPPSSIRFTNELIPAFGKNWKLFFVWGAILAILGLVALYESVFTTLLSILALGFLIFASGIIIAIDAFTYWRSQWQSFFLQALLAALYIVVGLLFIINPMHSSVILTFWLGILFVVLGAIRIVFSTASRSPYWVWGLINGFITLLLGIVVLANWPASSLFVIGILVGVELLFTGITYIMMSVTAHSVFKTLP